MRLLVFVINIKSRVWRSYLETWFEVEFSQFRANLNCFKLEFCQCFFQSCLTLLLEAASTVQLAAAQADNILVRNGLSLFKLHILQKIVKNYWRILEYFVRVRVHDLQFFLLKRSSWWIVAKSFSLGNIIIFFLKHIFSWSYSILNPSTTFAFAGEFHEYNNKRFSKRFLSLLE